MNISRYIRQSLKRLYFFKNLISSILSCASSSFFCVLQLGACKFTTTYQMMNAVKAVGRELISAAPSGEQFYLLVPPLFFLLSWPLFFFVSIPLLLSLYFSCLLFSSLSCLLFSPLSSLVFYFSSLLISSLLVLLLILLVLILRIHQLHCFSFLDNFFSSFHMLSSSFVFYVLLVLLVVLLLLICVRNDRILLEMQ